MTEIGNEGINENWDEEMNEDINEFRYLNGK
jgi:hypothetical protein